ncbi:MAG TPA: RICIN domain-containing protein [Amycolatopsis sp.]|nr:RICIN domain-containing protein [Amycolatopsis sp.]
MVITRPIPRTTPPRSWTDTTGTAVGDGRTAAEQTLKFTDAASLGGVHTLAAEPGRHPEMAVHPAIRRFLCADVEGGAFATGARVIQWTCTGGTNQRWAVAKQPDGGYKIASVRSGPPLTTASTSDGAAVTQRADTGSALQLWKIG